MPWVLMAPLRLEAPSPLSDADKSGVEKYNEKNDCRKESNRKKSNGKKVTEKK